MRVLLDESLPRQLAREIAGHEVRTVQQMQWAGLKNGELLRRAAEEFDAFVTADQNLEHQQSVRFSGITVFILIATSNRIESLIPLVPEFLSALRASQPGQVVRIGSVPQT